MYLKNLWVFPSINHKFRYLLEPLWQAIVANLNLKILAHLRLSLGKIYRITYINLSENKPVLHNSRLDQHEN